jgi:hypothetical protein
MPPWLLFSGIARLARGERMRKATTDENRLGAFAFFLTAFGFILFLVIAKYAKGWMDRFNQASPVTLWIFATIALTAAVFGSIYWCRVVSSKVTVILAVVAWMILFWMLFYLGLWDFAKL